MLQFTSWINYKGFCCFVYNSPDEFSQKLWYHGDGLQNEFCVEIFTPSALTQTSCSLYSTTLFEYKNLR